MAILSKSGLKINEKEFYRFGNKLINLLGEKNHNPTVSNPYIIKNSFDQLGGDCEVLYITHQELSSCEKLTTSERFRIDQIHSLDKTYTFGVYDQNYKGTAGFLGNIKWDGDTFHYAFNASYMPNVPYECLKMILETIQCAKLKCYEFENPF